MAIKLNPVRHLAKLKREAFSHGEKFASEDAAVADPIGLKNIGAVYTVVPPGKAACPFHVHHMEDEMFVILSGKGSYRFGDDVFAVGAGDVLGAPAGRTEFAHQLTNVWEEPLCYLAVSSISDTEVCEYPDSGKFYVRSRRSTANRFSFIGRREQEVGYFDGEED